MSGDVLVESGAREETRPALPAGDVPWVVRHAGQLVRFGDLGVVVERLRAAGSERVHDGSG